MKGDSIFRASPIHLCFPWTCEYQRVADDPEFPGSGPRRGVYISTEWFGIVLAFPPTAFWVNVPWNRVESAKPTEDFSKNWDMTRPPEDD